MAKRTARQQQNNGATPKERGAGILSDVEVIAKDDIVNNIIEKITVLFGEGELLLLSPEDRVELAVGVLNIMQQGLGIVLAPYIKRYNSGQEIAVAEFVLEKGK